MNRATSITLARLGRNYPDIAVRVCAVALVATAAVLGAVPAMATPAPTIPTLEGSDISAWITAGISAMAATVGVAIGGYVAFLIVRKGLRWMGKALG